MFDFCFGLSCGLGWVCIFGVILRTVQSQFIYSDFFRDEEEKENKNEDKCMQSYERMLYIVSLRK